MRATSDGATRQALGQAAGTADLEEAMMTVIIHGDFNCPYSYLASQRADLLSEARAAVDWRRSRLGLGRTRAAGTARRHCILNFYY